MANVLVEETSLSNIASAIREKSGGSATYKPGEMAAAISNLPTGGNNDGFVMDTIVNYENTTVTKIRQRCFTYLNKLATVTLPNVVEVGNSAFSHCSALAQVSLPKVTTIEDNGFDHCYSLLNANWLNTKTLGQGAFDFCKSLTSINFPQVEIIRNATFLNCYNLRKADLGSCKEFIGMYHFTGCSKLTALILRSNTVCSVSYPVNKNNQGSLFDTPITAADGEGYVYVPRALVDQYKSATNWTVIADRFRAIEDYPDITGG